MAPCQRIHVDAMSAGVLPVPIVPIVADRSTLKYGDSHKCQTIEYGKGDGAFEQIPDYRPWKDP